MLLIWSLIKLSRAIIILAREGVFLEFNSDVFPPISPFVSIANFFAKKKNISSGSALVKALPKIGPFYVKLGQFLATRPDVVGSNLANSLTALQDRMDPFSQITAESIIVKTFNKDLHDVFMTFSEPVAAASVAQVHRAQVLRGSQVYDVAVKIMRPGIKDKFIQNLSELRVLAIFAEKVSREARRLKFVEVVDTLARTIAFETDFRMEAAAITEFAERITDSTSIRVPLVHWGLTSRNVLTLEWIDGISLSDPEAIAAAGHDLKNIARIILQSFLRQALFEGIFHADMHQGNLFVDRTGRLVLIDFGITGRLGLKERTFLAESLYSLISRNYKRASVLHFSAGYVSNKYSIDEFAQALRATFEKMHAINAPDISMATILSHLFETQSLFDMPTRTPLVLFERTMVVAEGVARACDPSINLWNIYEPVVTEWMNASLGFNSRLQHGKKGALELSRLAVRLPETLNNIDLILNNFSSQCIDISQSSYDKLARMQRRSDLKLLVCQTFVIFFVLYCLIKKNSDYQ